LIASIYSKLLAIYRVNDIVLRQLCSAKAMIVPARDKHWSDVNIYWTQSRL